ncbi:choice-of-anchor D domain-containing protein [Candidatus Acetothermia bacterium]|nr:choice-of-anchor D domain-containing protein [Candidatus Acetothermia bacterium]MCI2436726.1 choice-of-anchor D domain-containing protein [Candidatus Acetothermia bacterium]
MALKGGTISVSPAQLSYTVFVGSPQEQKITLKNDGAVAATVTLSGLSAPFVLVNAYQAAMVLSGGQSLEVGLRFDPTGSGSFNVTTQLSLSGTCVRWSEEVLDGRSQCLEQSVAQGNASVALAGVAHKIKLEPEELNFYTVLVSSLHEQWMTITNTGTTSVTLALGGLAPPYRVSPPYRTLAENPFTLAPNQSQELIVEFNPQAVGAYTQSMRLHSNKAILEVPMQGAAQMQEWFDQQWQAYLDALLKTYHAACDTGIERGSVVGSSLFVPQSADSSVVFHGLCSLTPQQLEELLAWEDSGSLPDQIVPIPPAWWDHQQALQGLLSALQAYQQGGQAPLDALYGRIKRLITPNDALYNPHFAWFYSQMLSTSLNDLAGLTSTIVTLLSPFLSPITSTLLGLLSILQTPISPGLNEADRFLAALVLAMNQYPQVANAMSGLLRIQKDRPFYLAHAIGSIITLAGLTEVDAFSRQGLNSNLYNMFLGRLAQLPNFPELGKEYISTFLRTLTSLALSQMPEQYANMVAGFILYVDVAKSIRARGGVVNLIPAAAFWLPNRSSLDVGFGGLPESIARFVHLIATFDIQGLRGTQRVTIFAHAQAKLLNEDVESVVSNILNTIEKGAKWMWEVGGPRFAADGTPVIVIMAYDAEENAVENLRWKLYDAFRAGVYSWPVVIITKDENGNVKAICVCLTMGSQQAEAFAKAIASAMGYEPGKPFPAPEEEVLQLRPFFGYTNKQIRDAAFECQWWEADPIADPNGFWECMQRKLPPKPHRPV